MAESNSTKINVEYQELPDNPGYRVGSDGTIWSRLKKRGGHRREWRQIKVSVSKLGYANIRLRVDGKNKTFTMHRLVAMAFLPNPENKAEVNHKNGVKLDNSIGNLEWVTKSENHFHAYRTGLRTKRLGENNSAVKLTAEKVTEIRRRYAQGGETFKGLAKVFCVSDQVISSVVRRKTWRHILP